MAQLTTVQAQASQQAPSVASAFRPLVVDVALPLGVYYLANKGFGLGLVPSLILSSVIPGVRTVFSAVRDRAFNGLAGLVLLVNVAGIALSFVTGSARFILVKDSALSSVVGIVVIVSALRGKPLMTAGLKPWVTKGQAARTAAWDRLAAGSDRFRRLERRFSLIWGAALLAECVARVVGAFTLPVATMVWLSTVMLLTAIGIATVVGGGSTAEPMEKMVKAEAL